MVLGPACNEAEQAAPLAGGAAALAVEAAERTARGEADALCGFCAGGSGNSGSFREPTARVARQASSARAGLTSCITTDVLVVDREAAVADEPTVLTLGPAR